MDRYPHPRTERQLHDMAPKVINGKTYQPTVFPDGVVRNVLVASAETQSVMPRPISERYLPATQAASGQEMLQYGSVESLTPQEKVAQLERARRALNQMEGTLDEQLEAARLELERQQQRVDKDALLAVMGDQSGMRPIVTSSDNDYMTASNVAYQPETQYDDTAVVPEQSKVTGKKRRRAIGASAVAGVLLVGGGAYAASAGILPGISQATVQTQPTTNPIVIPPLSAAALVDAFGGCLDNKGAGKALFQGSVSSETPVSWTFTDTAKATKVVEFQGTDSKGVVTATNLKPVVKHVQAPVDYAACVPKEARQSVVKLEGDTATVDLAKIQPQLFEGVNQLTRGIPTDDPKKVFDLKNLLDQVVKGGLMTAAEEARLLKDYGNKTNIAAEQAQAQVQTAKLLAQADGGYSQQAVATIKTEIAAAVNAKVAALKKQGLSKNDSVNVTFVGDLKTPLVTNADPPKATKFKLDASKITDFTIKYTPGSASDLAGK